MKKNALTLTIIANMTSNYGEGIGNISSVQKVYKYGRIYAVRSRESLKNAICVQSDMYSDLQTDVKGATQKRVSSELNAATCKALEGGYMSTQDITYIRNSSFYLTDAVAVEPFIDETRFHNNLYLAQNYAAANGKNLQVSKEAGECGLMPYQYEYDKSMKIYSFTIDLEKVGKDDNFNAEADNAEKIDRVTALLDTIENLSLVVKGNLDNAEPVFVAGGMSARKTHMFENAVAVSGRKLIIEPVKQKLEKGFKCALLRNGELLNEDEIIKQLSPMTVTEFFAELKEQVKAYYSE